MFESSCCLLGSILSRADCMIPSRSADYNKMFQVHHKLYRHLCVYSTSRDKRNLQTTKLTIQLSILISWDSHIYSPLTGTSLPFYEQNRRTTPLHPPHHIFHMHHSVYPISPYNSMAIGAVLWEIAYVTQKRNSRFTDAEQV